MDKEISMKLGDIRCKIRVLPCSAKSPTELAAVRSEADALCTHGILMSGSGDDLTVFVRWGSGTLRAYGKDVASCDSSLTFHPIQHWLNFLHQGGLTTAATELYAFHAKAQAFFQATARHAGEVDKIRLQVMDGFWRTFSGAWDTTVKNGFVVNYKMFIVIIQILEKYYEPGTKFELDFNQWLEKEASSLGLTLTDEPIKDQLPEYATFLKCYWAPRLDGEGYVFLRLPSAILTMGKTRTNWIHSTPGRNVLRSARYACHALARGHGLIDRESMILGPYLSMLDRVGIEWNWRKKNHALGMFHRLQEDATFKDFSGPEIPVDLKFVEDYIMTRYDITKEDLLDFEAFCEDITYDTFKPFTKLRTFGFLDKLRRVDYGETKALKSVLTSSN
jgi:hypothetical protein